MRTSASMQDPEQLRQTIASLQSQVKTTYGYARARLRRQIASIYDTLELIERNRREREGWTQEELEALPF